MDLSGLKPISSNIDFPKEEEKILEFWRQIDVFQQQLKLSKDRPKYTFYDGPPFATGLPHYGHILAGTIKDVVTRYATASGFYVERRFGWDCHGLPVEYEIDKANNITGPADVEKMGIDVYNDKCRSIVMRYAGEWEQIVERLGRWIDFRNDYKTMYPWFMESIWWVFKQIYNKGMVYRGFKVMPFSTACHTPLSNFEASQNYKEVVDPAIIISFPLESDPEVSLIAWTTTPWTLPSNLALCVHPDMEYVRVCDVKKKRVYIMMEARLSALFKKPEEFQILDKFQGKSLFGVRYIPLFDYFLGMKSDKPDAGAFRVLTDAYVTSSEGTGVVHQAPGFGEDDYRVCLANQVFLKSEAVVCPVDESGIFKPEVRDFQGIYVKDADKKIIKHLNTQGRLVHNSSAKHNYPFCWRSDTPLLYKAVPSWFIRVEDIIPKLLENNKKSYWVPEFVQEKRFHNWLESSHDWAISRNRYWGTPIPIWTNPDFSEVVCIGSIQELEELSGEKISDLHRENIDHIEIKSRTGGPNLRRISEVLDCWFESGSMPYAQAHYPFDKKKQFDSCFPADFIAEGIDQTRGWFYTLLVISTILYGKPPFKNLVVNGIVKASNGQKMSKRLKNYPDPILVVNKFGSDALRLYLVTSPAVRGEDLKFREEGVKDIVKDVFLPWFNAYRFLVQTIILKEEVTNTKFQFDETSILHPENRLDKWILSVSQILIKFVKSEMKIYHLYTVTPRLLLFIEQLTKWYLRLNKRRLKGEEGQGEWDVSLRTLFAVILNMVKLMSSFTPFITEFMYQNLKLALALPPHVNKNNNKQISKHLSETESVHYLLLPDSKDDYIDKEIELGVANLQAVIELGWIIREKNAVPLKQPLRTFVIISDNQEFIDLTTPYVSYIKEELNVQEVVWSNEPLRFGYYRGAEPEFQALGLRVKGSMSAVAEKIRQLDEDSILKLKNGEFDQLAIEGFQIGPDDIRTVFRKKEQHSSFFEAQSNENVLVLLSVCPNYQLMEEGVLREATNRVQRLRKFMKLSQTDCVDISYQMLPAKFIGCSQELVSYGKSILTELLNECLTQSSQLVLSSSIDPDQGYSMLECCIAWLQGESVVRLEDVLEGEKVRVLTLSREKLDQKADNLYGELTKWSQDFLSTLTNQKITPAILEAVSNLVSNIGKSEKPATDPKSKFREAPKNYKNIIEKETKLEPKEVLYFVSEIEARFVEMCRQDSAEIEHNLKDIQAKLELKLKELFSDAKQRLKQDLESFTHEPHPLTLEKKQSLQTEWVSTLKNKIEAWMEQFQILEQLLRGFGEELNSKCFTQQQVLEKKSKSLIIEKAFQKLNATRFIRIQFGLIEAIRTSLPFCDSTGVVYKTHATQVLLENPKGCSIPMTDVVANIRNVLDIERSTGNLRENSKFGRKTTTFFKDSKHGVSARVEEHEELARCAYVNIEFEDSGKTERATVLLETPVGYNYVLTRTELVKKIKIILDTRKNIQVFQGTSLVPYSWDSVDLMSGRTLTVSTL